MYIGVFQIDVRFFTYSASTNKEKIVASLCCTCVKLNKSEIIRGEF